MIVRRRFPSLFRFHGGLIGTAREGAPDNRSPGLCPGNRAGRASAAAQAAAT